MNLSRRDFGKVALAALPASRLLAKTDSKFGGVQIGINAPTPSMARSIAETSVSAR